MIKITIAIGLVFILAGVAIASSQGVMYSSPIYEEQGDQALLRIWYRSGWNLVPVFFSAGASPNNIESSDFHSMWYYDSENEEYIEFSPQTSAPFTGDEDPKFLDFLTRKYPSYTPAWAYVKNNLADDSYVNYTLYNLDNLFLPVNDIKLNKGWNFMFVVPEMEGESFNSMKGDCEFIKYNMWSAVEQKWGFNPSMSFIEYPEMFDTPFNGHTGNSFVIKVAEDCQLASSIGSITPPALPL